MKRQELNKRTILRLLKQNAEGIKSFSVKRIGLFGSFNKEIQKRGSDIDFLVVFENPTFDNYMGLRFFLEKLFHRKIDLVTEKNLKPALKYITQEAVYAEI